jgi:hypothetical protein
MLTYPILWIERDADGSYLAKLQRWEEVPGGYWSPDGNTHTAAYWRRLAKGSGWICRKATKEEEAQ